MFSHDENSAAYSACNVKGGDISSWNGKSSYMGQSSNLPLYDYKQQANTVLIENKIKPKNMYGYFMYTNATTFTNMNKIDTSDCVDMGSCFWLCKNVSSLNLSSWDTSKVTSMNSMFGNCSNLSSVSLNNWDTSSVQDMRDMFSMTSNGQKTELTHLDLSSFDTSGLRMQSLYGTNQGGMANMFNYCSKLTTIVYGDKFVKPSYWQTTYPQSNNEGTFTNCPANKPSWW